MGRSRKKSGKGKSSEKSIYWRTRRKKSKRGAKKMMGGQCRWKFDNTEGLRAKHQIITVNNLLLTVNRRTVGYVGSSIFCCTENLWTYKSELLVAFRDFLAHIWLMGATKHKKLIPFLCLFTHINDWVFVYLHFCLFFYAVKIKHGRHRYGKKETYLRRKIK